MSEIEVQFSDAEWDQIGEVVVSARMDDKRIDRALLDAGQIIGAIVTARVEQAITDARAEARRDALLEAAGEWRSPIVCATCMYVSKWLRDRAALSDLGSDQ